jgi:hypothetical protein
LLSLDGVAAVGRWHRDALGPTSLVGYELRHGRLEAIYSPAGWGEMTVRAAWSHVGDDSVDLEVQVSTRAIEPLRRVEIKVLSVWPDAEATFEPIPRWVEPRDARSAGLSYDGRELDLRGLTTLPPRLDAFQTPRIVSGAATDGRVYVEMVHPDDVTRRIREGGRSLARSRTTRYGLLGHDLERGVVLRGRIRGIWLPPDASKDEAFVRMEQFLREPPPLGP